MRLANAALFIVSKKNVKFDICNCAGRCSFAESTVFYLALFSILSNNQKPVISGHYAADNC